MIMSINDPFLRIAREEHQGLYRKTFEDMTGWRKWLWAVLGVAYWIVAGPIIVIGSAAVVGLLLLIWIVVLPVGMGFAVLQAAGVRCYRRLKIGKSGTR